MVVVALLDVVEIEQANTEQQSSVADGHNNEGHPTNVAHLSVKLEVSFPSKRLMSPLHNPGNRSKNYCHDNRSGLYAG